MAREKTMKLCTECWSVADDPGSYCFSCYGEVIDLGYSSQTWAELSAEEQSKIIAAEKEAWENAQQESAKDAKQGGRNGAKTLCAIIGGIAAAVFCFAGVSMLMIRDDFNTLWSAYYHAAGIMNIGFGFVSLMFCTYIFTK